MPRAKKSLRLSAKERALLTRLDRLSEEEIKRLTTREIFANFKLIDKAGSRAAKAVRLLFDLVRNTDEGPTEKQRGQVEALAGQGIEAKRIVDARLNAQNR